MKNAAKIILLLSVFASYQCKKTNTELPTEKTITPSFTVVDNQGRDITEEVETSVKFFNDLNELTSDELARLNLNNEDIIKVGNITNDGTGGSAYRCSPYSNYTYTSDLPSCMESSRITSVFSIAGSCDLGNPCTFVITYFGRANSGESCFWTTGNNTTSASSVIITIRVIVGCGGSNGFRIQGASEGGSWETLVTGSLNCTPCGHTEGM